MVQQMMVLPPSNGGHNPISVGGRSYTGSAGSFLTVPYQDGLTMLANGWVTNCVNGCGTSANRPAAGSAGVPIGMPGITFFDTTLNETIMWDGVAWRHTVTGAVV